MNTPDINNSGLKNQAPRARALRMLRQWIEQGVWHSGEALPAEREIAQKLDVGLATVQRALRVLETDGLITKHNGRTRTVARPQENDKHLMSDSVLVMGTSDWVPSPQDSEPFGWGGYVAVGALRALSEAGLHTMVVPPQGLDPARFDRLLSSEPLGLIIPEVDDPSLIPATWAKWAREKNVQTVVFGDEAWCTSFDRVVPDHDTGAYDLTKWLLARGRRNIRQYWTFVPSANAWSRARQQGYERAMREAGLQAMEPVISLDATYGSGDEKLEFLARSQAVAGALVPFVLGSNKPTDSLMIVSDGSVASVAAGLRLLGKTPNTDIELVGYDNYWDQSFVRQFEPVGPLATIDKKNIDAGRQLTALLMERRSGKLPPEPQLRMVKPVMRVLPVA